MGTKSEALKQEFDELAAKAKTLRDEIRLDIHLAGMDARDAWTELERKIDQADHYVDGVAEQITEEIKDGLHELLGKLKGFQKRMKGDEEKS